MDTEFQYEYFVIGGGSGGLASAKTAGKLGAKVALADFVTPSPIGTTWGLGGTCVNVGCIPKKLMHFASMIGHLRHDQKEAGWVDINTESKHDWNVMVKNVQNHIKKLNWGYKSELIQNGVKYYNKRAEFVDEHTLKLTDAKGNSEQVTAKNILIAVGGRPTMLDIPGSEKLVITSDDLFSMKKSPGKILVVGASYVALECAGFTNGLGYDTTVMVRSILLRGFDQEISEKIGEFMQEEGVKLIRGSVPENIEMVEGDKRLVTWKKDGQVHQEVFDTVLVAIGRYADTTKLNLKAVNVQLDKSGKIICTPDDRTNIPNIFALGDCVLGRPELTPTAIKCGQYLALRLFGGSNALMDYEFVATTVFTPLEYGCIGYSEEEAKKVFGEEDIKVYHSIFKPLEWNFLQSHSASSCYAKVIVYDIDNRVVGLHYLGPNAGEVVQGYAVAMKMGMTKAQLDSTVGIHPTTSEEIVQLKAIKGVDDAQKEGC